MNTIFCRLALSLLALCFLTTSCNLEKQDPQPTSRPILLLKVATSNGDSRDFTYTPDGWLTKVTGTGFLALNENEQSSSKIIFDSWGRIGYVLTDGPDLDTENVYHYTSDNLLYKLEELIDKKVESYHTFEYDANKKLAVRYSYFKPLDTDIPLQTLKRTYTYENGNVSEVKHYHKTSPTGAWELVQTSKYEGYDTSKAVNHLTDYLFTPGIVLHHNNPAKVTNTLASGEVRVTTYTYQYNEQNLPVKKTTTPQTGTSYTTEFTYRY